MPLPGLTLIEPRTGWRSLQLSELWLYRHLLLAFVARDFKTAHKQTLLGTTWILVAPLATVATYTIVFGRLFQLPSDGHPYPLLVFSGQYLWGAFSVAVTATTGSVVGNSHFIQKVYFPRLLLPIAAAVSGALNLGLVLVSLLSIMLWYDYWPSLPTLLAPAVVALVLATACGLGMLLAPLHAVYRDVGRSVSFVLQLGFFLTPVLYPASHVPAHFKWLLMANPMAGYISTFRWCLYGAPLDLHLLQSSLAATVVLVCAGAFCYVRVQGRLADVI